MKYVIDSDRKSNLSLREQLSTVRGGMAEQIHRQAACLPIRFEVIPCEDAPAMLIRDQITGKEIKVGLCDMRGAMQALEAFA